MSKKYALKRIALVAVSALGFGLMSVVPASATAVSAITNVVPAVKGSPADTTLVLVAAGSLGTRYSSYTLYTNDGTVAVSDLNLTVNAGYASAGDTYEVTFSPDGIATGSALANYKKVKTAATTAASGTGASVSTRVLSNMSDNVGTYALTTGSTSLNVGTHYMYVQGTFAADYTAADDWKIQLNIANPTMTNVVPTITNSSTTLAGRVGQQVSIPVSSQNPVLAAGAGIRPFQRYAASITAQPNPGTGQSVVYPTLTAGSATINTTLTRYDLAQSVSTGSTVLISASAASRGTAANATGPSSVLYTTTLASGAAVAAVTSNQTVGTVTFTPVTTGTYSLVVWSESSATGIPSLSGSESSQTFTINVSAGVSTITMTPTNSSSSTQSSSKGSLVKMTLKDAAGNATTLSPGEAVTVTPSGSAIIAKVNNNAASSTAGQVWNLSAANFNTSGVAWINVTDTVAESATITASISGGTSASTTLTFADTVDVGATPAISSLATGANTTTGASMKIPLGASTLSWRATASTGSAVGYSVTESLNSSVGTITGYTTALSYTGVASGNTTLGYASFSVTATTTAAGQSYTLSTDADASSTPSTVTSEATTAGVLAVTPSTVNAVAGATNSFTALLKDKFKRAYASQTVSVTVTGKNPTASATTLVTDATGRVTFSLTDANTNTAVTDTVTFTSGSAVAVSVSYGTNAASTVTVASDDYSVTGVANDAITPNAIATAYTGAQAGARTVTATVKNAAGALLAGVPVVFTVSGTTAAVTSTTQTVYTSVSGTASASVYGWATGTYTVTATAGGIAGTATVSFYSTGDDSVRTVSATAAGNQVTGMAKDRFGNPVQGATLYAKVTTGAGNIGGALTATGTTDSTGSVIWIVSDASSTVTVSNISFSAVAGTVVGQTSAAKGFDVGGADATAFTATTVGTTTTAETGVGASFDAAGVSSATVTVSVDNAAEEATDAALEATDAANAATDAANLAAEAADAATVAAEEARDAADAATAAVEELATQVATLMAALKAQITTLANTVAKIAKKVKA